MLPEPTPDYFARMADHYLKCSREAQTHDKSMIHWQKAATFAKLAEYITYRDIAFYNTPEQDTSIPVNNTGEINNG